MPKQTKTKADEKASDRSLSDLEQAFTSLADAEYGPAPDGGFHQTERFAEAFKWFKYGIVYGRSRYQRYADFSTEEGKAFRDKFVDEAFVDQGENWIALDKTVTDKVQSEPGTCSTD